jgi:hypothetical protein
MKLWSEDMGNIIDRVFNFQNFFDEDERDFVKKSLNDYGQWNLVEWSDLSYEGNRMFWSKQLIEHKGLVWLFKDKIEKFITKPIEVTRFYANGQAHGQCGLFHSDVQAFEQGEYGSLVYFIHDDWNPEYGGHLLIKEDDELISVLPETNSAVLFDSKKYHCALEPTIYCRTQRISLAFKFRIL